MSSRSRNSANEQISREQCVQLANNYANRGTRTTIINPVSGRAVDVSGDSRTMRQLARTCISRLGDGARSNSNSSVLATLNEMVGNRTRPTTAARRRVSHTSPPPVSPPRVSQAAPTSPPPLVRRRRPEIAPIRRGTRVRTSPPVVKSQSISHSPLARPIYGESPESPGNANVSTQGCTALLRDIRVNGNHFRPFANKLLKICVDVQDRQNCGIIPLNAIMTSLQQKYFEPAIDDKIVFPRVVEGSELTYLIDTALRVPVEDRIAFFKLPLKNQNKFMFTVHYTNARGTIDRRLIDAGGPIRQFFSNVAKQMFESKYFKKVNTSYTLNPNFDTNMSPAGKCEKFHVLGLITAFLMLNGFKHEHHFSRAILARFLYKPNEMTDADYALYHLLDVPSLAVMMRDPDSIEYAGLEMSDDTAVTKANYENYLVEQGRYAVGSDPRYIEAFREGFYISYRVLRNKSVSMSQLDALLTGSEITKEIVMAMVGMILASTTSPPEICIINFIKILVSTNEEYPFDFANGEEHLPKDKNEFMKRLLFFWTGVRSFNDRFPYSVVSTTGDHFIGHTCGFYIEIPRMFSQPVAGRLPMDMYKQLISTVAVEGGFGFA